jgi:cytochrome c553
MKTTLFLSFLLFITACSDSTTEKAATQSEPEAKEVTQAQEKPIVQQAPAEAEPTSATADPAPVEVESTPAEAAPAPVETAPAPATAEPATVAAKVSAKETAPVSGHALFAHQCASCHGKDGEKSALNTSKVIAGWDEKKILAALKGYKEGSYGGKLKAIMKGQVTGLNEEELKAVAAYISTL